MRFSFVVPACNVAPYAKTMIDSLKCQTDPCFEALVINEESNDNTAEVLQQAIGDDIRFTLIKKPRSGSASVSRNYGIEHSKGDYIVFIDGDDWIEPDSLERFGKELNAAGNPDLLLVDWVIHYRNPAGTESVENVRCHFLEPHRVYSGPESLAIRLETYFQPGSPAHICRRKFLMENNLRQIQGRRHQDCEWMPRVNYAARSVVYFPYNYASSPEFMGELRFR